MIFYVLFEIFSSLFPSYQFFYQNFDFPTANGLNFCLPGVFSFPCKFTFSKRSIYLLKKSSDSWISLKSGEPCIYPGFDPQGYNYICGEWTYLWFKESLWGLIITKANMGRKKNRKKLISRFLFQNYTKNICKCQKSRILPNKNRNTNQKFLDQNRVKNAAVLPQGGVGERTTSGGKIRREFCGLGR